MDKSGITGAATGGGSAHAAAVAKKPADKMASIPDDVWDNILAFSNGADIQRFSSVSKLAARITTRHVSLKMVPVFKRYVIDLIESIPSSDDPASESLLVPLRYINGLLDTSHNFKCGYHPAHPQTTSDLRTLLLHAGSTVEEFLSGVKSSRAIPKPTVVQKFIELRHLLTYVDDFNGDSEIKCGRFFVDSSEFKEAFQKLLAFGEIMYALELAKAPVIKEYSVLRKSNLKAVAVKSAFCGHFEISLEAIESLDLSDRDDAFGKVALEAARADMSDLEEKALSYIRDKSVKRFYASYG